MASLHDVYTKVKEAEESKSLFGHTADWQLAFDGKVLELGFAIMEEHSVTPEEGRKLPRETPLGPKAEAAFNELCKMVDE